MAKQATKRKLCLINEYLKSVLNAAAATQIVLQRPARIINTPALNSHEMV